MNTKGFWYKDSTVLVTRQSNQINFKVAISKGLYRWTFEDVQGRDLEMVLEILSESDAKPATTWKECLAVFGQTNLVFA